jgi:thymidine kinase
MSKLYFIHAPMNGGKSAHLLMKAHSFLENDTPILCLKPSIDNRENCEKINSRIGLSIECLTIDIDDNIYLIINDYCSNMEGMGQPIPKWILCDESQFFTEEHINQLAKIVDILDINVMCYGLRNDFTGHLFEGSKRLFELADNIEEIKLSCKCGKKAIINARIDEYGSILREGEQILIGGNESYKSMCRQCFFKNKDENEII